MSESGVSESSGTDSIRSPEPLTVFVTGATGFVGRHVVNQAASSGMKVVALVRPSSDVTVLTPAADSGNLTLVHGDLSSSRGLAEAMAGCDVLIHLAAVKGGDFFARFSGTVIGTENALAGASGAGVRNLVAMSTFSVYDYGKRPAHSVLDETFPVIDNPVGRDEYAETKLYQDELYRNFGHKELGNQVVLLRPGMIYGAGQLWHPLLGGEFGPINLRVGLRARPPITYVENVAEAVLLAAKGLVDPEAGKLLDGQVINIVDDQLPTQSEYVSKVAPLIDAPTSILVPLPLMKGAARFGAFINRTVFQGRLKLPSIALPDQVDARFKPFEYPNLKAKKLLGWKPRYSFSEAVSRSLGEAGSQSLDG